MEMHPTDLHNRVLIYLLDCLRCHLIQACLELENAAGEDRTHDLRIMRPTRCQLRYCRLVYFNLQLTAIMFKVAPAK